MPELRVVAVSNDGTRLVLKAADSTEYTLPIDERLRAAVNGHLSRLGQLTMALESRISPREIQERVRGGESAEHVAVTAGVPLERVLRFVGPVLREREHVVEQARRARLAGSNGPTSLLADVVDRAATRQGVEAGSGEGRVRTRGSRAAPRQRTGDAPSRVRPRARRASRRAAADRRFGAGNRHARRRRRALSFQRLAN